MIVRARVVSPNQRCSGSRRWAGMFATSSGESIGGRRRRGAPGCSGSGPSRRPPRASGHRPGRAGRRAAGPRGRGRAPEGSAWVFLSCRPRWTDAILLPGAGGALTLGLPNMEKSSTLKSRGAGKDTTASVQDYLAAIYDLGGSGRAGIGARLAKHMAVSAPAVTESIQRLTRGRYVKVERGKELTLTTKGRQIAEVMARRHRLLERWLTDTLGLNWSDAHEEGHRPRPAPP